MPLFLVSGKKNADASDPLKFLIPSPAISSRFLRQLFFIRANFLSTSLVCCRSILVSHILSSLS